MLARASRMSMLNRGLGIVVLAAAIGLLAGYQPVAGASAAAGVAEGDAVLAGQPNLPDQPPTVPTPGPDPNTWRIRLGGFPDTVGVGGYQCQGCDGVFSDADRIGATDRPLQPLFVVVTEPGNPQNTYWVGLIDRASGGSLSVQREVLLRVPPPYQINLITVNPVGYTVCPNSRPVFIVSQDDFDAAGGGRPGAGRNLQHNWFFWRCRTVNPE